MIRACKICLAQHDEEIHAATNRVHGWFRVLVTEYLDLLDRPAPDPMPNAEEELETPELNAA